MAIFFGCLAEGRDRKLESNSALQSWSHPHSGRPTSARRREVADAVLITLRDELDKYNPDWATVQFLYLLTKEAKCQVNLESQTGAQILPSSHLAAGKSAKTWEMRWATCPRDPKQVQLPGKFPSWEMLPPQSAGTREELDLLNMQITPEVSSGTRAMQWALCSQTVPSVLGWSQKGTDRHRWSQRPTSQRGLNIELARRKRQEGFSGESVSSLWQSDTIK